MFTRENWKEIENEIERRDKMYEDQRARANKLHDSLEKLYTQELKKLRKELQQKENIIKEVREYIEMHTPSDIGICGNKTKRYYTLGEDSVDHILEILDKEKETGSDKE